MNKTIFEGDGMHEGSAHASIISLANKAVPAGVAVTGLGWLTHEIALGIAGLCAAIVFGCIGVYYRRKNDIRLELADKRKAEYFEWCKKQHRSDLIEKEK
jgi:hypothetical protein